MPTTQNNNANKVESNGKDWTIMVYLAGDNNLTEEMIFALKSMYGVGSPSKDTRIAVLYDSVGTSVPFDIPLKKRLPKLGQFNVQLNEARLKKGEDTFLDRRDGFIKKGGAIEDLQEAALNNRGVLFNESIVNAVHKAEKDPGINAGDLGDFFKVTKKLDALGEKDLKELDLKDLEDRVKKSKPLLEIQRTFLKENGLSASDLAGFVETKDILDKKHLAALDLFRDSKVGDSKVEVKDLEEFFAVHERLHVRFNDISTLLDAQKRLKVDLAHLMGYFKGREDAGSKTPLIKVDAQAKRALERVTDLIDRATKKIVAVDPALRRIRLALSESVSDMLQGFIIDTIERDIEEYGKGKRELPDRNYALVLSGHGSGAVGDFLTSNKQLFGLSIRGLRVALEGAQDYLAKKASLTRTKKWLDLLGFDSCLMSMAEVAYEVKSQVHYMVGAEGYEPNTGWPYDRVVAILHRNKQISPKMFASRIVEEHIQYYNDYTAGDLSVDLAAIDLSHLNGLIKLHGTDLAKLMKQELDRDPAIKDAILLAHWEAQGYKDEQYTDLFDFCDRLANRTKGKIKSACNRVKKAIASRRLIFQSGHCGAAFQHSHGISVFFPWANLRDAAGTTEVDHYGKLKFAKDTHWDDFLRSYFDKTIRKTRGEEEGKGKEKEENKRRSFLNLRSGLFTGDAQDEEAGGVKLPSSNFRLPSSNFRLPSSNFRLPSSNFRMPLSTFRQGSSAGSSSALKIAAMKNPPIYWFDDDE